MTKAQKWSKALNSWPLDDEGKFRIQGWHTALRAAMRSGVARWHEDHGRGCVDEPLLIKFDDGSVLRVANPNQECFFGVARVTYDF